MPAPRFFRLLEPDACEDIPGLLRIAEHVSDDEKPLSMILIEFEVEKFHVDAFAIYGITCPPTVRRAVLKRQAEFFFGRLAARWAMRFHGHDGIDIPVGLHREPVWPDELIGSISHSRRFAVAAICARTTCRGIGIDLEEVLAGDALTAVCHSVIDADESALLNNSAATEHDFRLLSTVAFSVKESFFKAAFGQVGRFFGFDALRVCGLNTKKCHLELEVTEDLVHGLRKGDTLLAGYMMVQPGTMMTWVICPPVRDPPHLQYGHKCPHWLVTV